ncbi:uncharacterized protein LOC106156919 [Lingula anatina]|uniref:Uncharacterized protein LOC106156919 n=1 Tax=Lingula anatina TaxID=7574 RepID=A0A1S3HRY2_LINAN|nr:uncharacterized protein LOC106156919 [Lingula anatina]|eukprot:XP_013387814.1 uncharacterized protein LOC106156919 [Lingula anatina]
MKTYTKSTVIILVTVPLFASVICGFGVPEFIGKRAGLKLHNLRQQPPDNYQVFRRKYSSWMPEFIGKRSGDAPSSLDRLQAFKDRMAVSQLEGSQFPSPAEWFLRKYVIMPREQAQAFYNQEDNMDNTDNRWQSY